MQHFLRRAAVTGGVALLMAGAADAAGATDSGRDDGATGTSLGCRVTLKASNTGSQGVAIRWTTSHVRTKVGWWKALAGAGAGVFKAGVRPGTDQTRLDRNETLSVVYETSFGCNAQRRWRFTLRRADGQEHMLYLPGSSYTTSTVINLGDISRVF